MIRTINCPPADEVSNGHFVYPFTHQDMDFKAYDEVGKALKCLRERIVTLYNAAKHDERRHVYYSDLIPNLERQFATMVSEGVLGGAIVIVAIRKERMVA